MRFPNLSVGNPEEALVSHPDSEMGHLGFMPNTQQTKNADGNQKLTEVTEV